MFRGIRQAVERIPLDSSENAPVFELWRTTTETEEAARYIADRIASFGGRLDDPNEEREAVRAIYEVVINRMLKGDKPYETVMDYVRAGRDIPDDELLVCVWPLVEYLIGAALEIAAVKDSEVIRRYTGDASAI